MANKVKRKTVTPTNYVSREEREEKKRKRNNMIIGMIMLAIMVFSVAGFALITGGGYGGNNNGNSRDIPFQQFTDPQSGQIFWGAVIDGEQFIFLDVAGFDDFTNFEIMANQLKSKTFVNIYIDDNFTSSDAIYNVEKVLNTFDILSSRTPELTCDANTLVLTNENIFEGECMVFVAPQGEESRFSEILVYHMIK